MIDFNARLSAAILGAGFALVQMQPAQALTKVEVSKVAQSITVMIQNAQDPKESGSGVIIKREGEIYTVLTAHHVVQQSPNYKLMTPDKKLYPIIQDSIQPLPGVDLALVQFKSPEAYGVAKMGDSTQSPSGSTSFVAGFPGTTEVRSEPEYYFTSGEIAANGSRPNKDGYALAYSNPTLPGMSGGAVLNEQGKLIGIHGRAEKAEKLQNSQASSNIYVLKTEFNYAIPINTFLTLAPQVNKTLAFTIPSTSVSSEPKADDFFLQADEKLKRADFNGAIEDFNQVLRLNPSYEAAYTGRGVARGNSGDTKGAIEDLSKAIQINPSNVRAYAARGLEKSKLGDKHGAEADLKKSLSLNIDDEDYRAYINRGNVRQALGDKQGAIADFDKTIRINPKYDVAYVNRGIARLSLEDKQGAIADFDQAIRINPKYVVAYVNRGIARASLGRVQSAIADFDQAIRLEPTEAGGYYNRGIARLSLGDNQGAITDFDQAIRFNPKYAKAYSNRGAIRSKLGDKQGAIADYDQAIRLDSKLAVAYVNRGYARNTSRDKQGAIADLQKATALFKAQGDEKNYQATLKFLQQVNGR
jgi:tetratricopeptide (TPR) repeat protein